MKIISFHLQGKMAHFRRFYSNSSALSYSIPPRTTIIGIVAGLLGWERDKYYESFSLEKCKIAVASCAPLKKCMQKLNLLMIKKEGDLNGSAEHHSQTATELIIPQNIRTGLIDYKVWIYHEDSNIMNSLERIINRDAPGYLSMGISIGLGTAYNLGCLDKGEVCEGEEKQEVADLTIASVIPVKSLLSIRTESIGSNEYRLVKEELPLEFNSQRRITASGLGDMIINLNSSPIPARVKAYTQLENGSSIMWME